MSSAEKDILVAQKLIEAYKSRVTRLERKERDLLCQLAIKREVIKDTKVEAESALAALVTAEEAIATLQASLEEQKRVTKRYEHWWLTENRSLKVVMENLPLPALKDLRHITSSSQARYAVYCDDSV